MIRTSRRLQMLYFFIIALMIFTSCTVKSSVNQQDNNMGSPENQENKPQFVNKNLEVAVFEGAYGRKYWDAIIEEFQEAYPGVKVTLTSSSRIAEILKPRFVSGDVPDFLYGAILPNYVSEGLLTELDDVFNSKAIDSDMKLIDKFMPVAIDTCKPLDDGKMYYGPAYYFVAGLFYNKAYFEQKGWGVPETWDELLSLGEAAKKEGKYLFTYQGLYPEYNENTFWPSLASLAGESAVLDCSNLKEGAFKTEAVKKVMKVYETIAEKGYLLPNTVAMNHTQAQIEFLKGRTLFCPNGNWFETEMKDAIPAEGFEFGFLGSPVFNKGEQKYSYIGVETFSIPKAAKNIELAKEFMKFNYTDEAIKLNAEKSGGLIPVKNAVELSKPYIPDSSYECFSIFNKGVKPIVFNYRLTPKGLMSLRQGLFDSMSDIMTRKMNTDQWSDYVEKVTGDIRKDLVK